MARTGLRFVAGGPGYARSILAISSLDRVLGSANSGITIADATVPGFPLTFVNAAFERLTGYRAKDIVGRNCRFLQGPETDPDAVAEIAAALRERREARVVVLNYRRDGTPFWNELRLAPVRDADGRVEQIIGVQHDITELVRAQRELEGERDQARIRLEAMSRRIAQQDQELAELRALQQALTPTDPPDRPQLDLASCFVPAEEGVAGDFYLVAPGPSDATVAVVGDVVGHGLEAARRATFVRAALATFTRFTDDPLRLLEMANHSLIERTGTSAEFVTAVCVTYRPTERRLLWAVAGHPVPLALDTGEELPSDARPGMPLGIEIDLGGTLADVEWSPGDGLLMFTDGLPEARPRPADDAERRRYVAPFGDARVKRLLRANAHLPPSAIVRTLREQAAAYTGGGFADDLCMLALRAAPA